MELEFQYTIGDIEYNVVADVVPEDNSFDAFNGFGHLNTFGDITYRCKSLKVWNGDKLGKLSPEDRTILEQYAEDLALQD